MTDPTTAQTRPSGLGRRGFLGALGAAAAGVAAGPALAGPAAARHRDRAAASRCGPASQELIAERLRGAARAEGRHRHQPDRGPARPDPRGRRDGGLGPGRPGGRVRTGARVPRHRAGRRLRGQLRRRAHRPDGLGHLPEERRRAGRHRPSLRRGHDGLRHPGRRRAVLHLHLDDVRLHGRGRRDRHALRRPGPAQPHDRTRAARPGARPGVRDVRRAPGDLPAARHDRRRAGPALRRGVPAGRDRPAAAGRRRADARLGPRQAYADTGLPWILPSPNMPTPDTALVYPGTCMFEGTNLSEGRGTTRPFELVGAPYVDERWAAGAARPGTSGSADPGGLLHPDVLQARQRGLRRASSCT